MKNELPGKVIIDETTIADGVNLVACMLNQDFSDAVVITVVPGGIFFTADLVRKLHFDIEMDYISCPHTPGDRNNQSDIVFHNNLGIEGRKVIILDDAIESGGTMKRLVEHLTNLYKPSSLSVATLFVKPGRVTIPATCYYAYEMESDDLLVGYGMPWKNKLRNLPYVCKLNISD